MTNRRELLVTSMGLLAGAMAGPANAATLDAGTRNWLRLTADLSGHATWAITLGDVWGFLPQADDLTTQTFARRLYGYWSLVVRKAQQNADGSVVLKLKAWTFYLDSTSGSIVTEITNPYTGVVVKCAPLSGPPVTLHYGDSDMLTPLDIRERRMGDTAWVELDRVSRFKPADTTWFKLEADLTSFTCRARDLDNARLDHVPNSWSHNLVAEWQTWMKMHGTPGHILFKGNGAFIAKPNEIPDALRTAINDHFPGTFAQTAGWSAP